MDIVQQLEEMRKKMQSALDEIPAEMREQILKETDILTKINQGINDINSKKNEYQSNFNRG